MKKNLFRVLLFVVCSLCWTTLLSEAANAAERTFVHPLFSDHQVLQRDCAGLPAVPFRTGDSPGITQGRH